MHYIVGGTRKYKRMADGGEQPNRHRKSNDLSWHTRQLQKKCISRKTRRRKNKFKINGAKGEEEEIKNVFALSLLNYAVQVTNAQIQFGERGKQGPRRAVSDNKNTNTTSRAAAAAAAATTNNRTHERKKKITQNELFCMQFAWPNIFQL